MLNEFHARLTSGSQFRDSFPFNDKFRRALDGYSTFGDGSQVLDVPLALAERRGILDEIRVFRTDGRHAL